MPPPKVEAWLIAPRAASVPVLNEPEVKLSVPDTVTMALAPR